MIKAHHQRRAAIAQRFGQVLFKPLGELQKPHIDDGGGAVGEKQLKHAPHFLVAVIGARLAPQEQLLAINRLDRQQRVAQRERARDVVAHLR